MAGLARQHADRRQRAVAGRRRPGGGGDGRAGTGAHRVAAVQTRRSNKRWPGWSEVLNRSSPPDGCHGAGAGRHPRQAAGTASDRARGRHDHGGRAPGDRAGRTAVRQHPEPTRNCHPRFATTIVGDRSSRDRRCAWPLREPEMLVSTQPPRPGSSSTALGAAGGGHAAGRRSRAAWPCSRSGQAPGRLDVVSARPRPSGGDYGRAPRCELDAFLDLTSCKSELDAARASVDRRLATRRAARGCW